ncbi:sensor histidine kinase [Domibacillus tundrae]|uniref:sensor histidine kinase n=1 Tax=Domibacillus tundrae TaxID=1587527 RepID=UPI000617ECC2|nr:HAMP domain-containing sensor histidine kinase [Domibacillus tundrae]
MKLGTRIQLSITGLIVLLLLTANTAIYLLFESRSISSEQDRLIGIAETVIEKLNSREDQTTEQVLQTYLISNGLIRIVLEEGTPVDQVSTDNDFFFIQTAFKDDQFEQVITFRDARFAVVSVPVIGDDGAVINLQIVENIDRLYKTIDDLRWVLIVTSIVLAFILFLVSWFLSKWISRPIQELTYTMKTIEENESYERIDVKRETKDELAILASTFNRMIDRLEASYIKQEQFVSDASHELKTPLTVIFSYVKLLRRWGTTRPDVMEEALSAIESESGRMRYLTEQLLQLAVSEELIENERGKMNISPLVEQTIKRLRVMYENHIQYTIQRSVIMADVHEQSFVQLLVILLDNAGKYSDDVIHVSLAQDNEIIQLQVKDYGIGIPKEAQPYIFDRLYRVDKVRGRKTGGSGLGLSIAKRIAEQHGGMIKMSSTEQEGSVFTVLLPKSEA